MTVREGSARACVCEHTFVSVDDDEDSDVDFTFPADLDIWAPGRGSMTVGDLRQLGTPGEEDFEWYQYIEGYRTAARTLVEQLCDGHGASYLLIHPIISNYRHAVEIALKHATLVGARYLKEPSVDFSDGHSLVSLWVAAESLMARAFPHDPCHPFLDRVIRQLDSVDPRGIVFRYPVTTKQQGRRRTIPRELEAVDLYNFATYVDQVVGLLLGAVCGMTEMQRFEEEIEEEMRHLEYY